MVFHVYDSNDDLSIYTKEINKNDDIIGMKITNEVLNKINK